MRRPLRWSAGLLCLTLLGPARSALAESRISVPDGCGSEKEFSSEIERLTGAPASEAAASSLRIEPRGEGGYELRLALGDEVRTLRDPECRVLWRSALVIVAAASTSPPATPSEPPAAAPSPAREAPSRSLERITPAAPARARALARAAGPGELARAHAGSSGAARARSPESRSRRLARPRPELAKPALGTAVDAPAVSEQPSAAPHWGLAAGAGMSGGVVPGLGPALELSAQLEVLPWSTVLSVRYWPERSEVVGGRGVDVSGFGGRGAVLFRAAPAVDVLAGLELMRLVGTGAQGVSGRNADAAWQLAPTLGINWLVHDFGHLRIELGVAGRVSLQRPRFVVTGYGDLYRAPALGGDAIIRGVWLFR